MTTPSAKGRLHLIAHDLREQDVWLYCAAISEAEAITEAEARMDAAETSTENEE